MKVEQTPFVCLLVWNACTEYWAPLRVYYRLRRDIGRAALCVRFLICAQWRVTFTVTRGFRRSNNIRTASDLNAWACGCFRLRIEWNIFITVAIGATTRADDATRAIRCDGIPVKRFIGRELSDIIPTKSQKTLRRWEWINNSSDLQLGVQHGHNTRETLRTQWK